MSTEEIETPKPRGRRARKDDPTQRPTVLPDVSDDPRDILSNGADEDTYLFYRGQILKAAAVKTAAHAKLKKIRKEAKEAGIPLGLMDLADRVMRMTDVTPAEWVRDLLQTFRFERLYDANGQGDMFDQSEIDASVIKKAASEGYASGLQGLTAENPHGPETPAWQVWQEGWQRGQRVLHDRFLAKNVEGNA